MDPEKRELGHAARKKLEMVLKVSILSPDVEWAIRNAILALDELIRDDSAVNGSG